MLTNTPVVLYNYYKDKASKQEMWFRTILDAVQWEDYLGISAIASSGRGMRPDPGVWVAIPFLVKAEGKQYVMPKKFAALSLEELPRYWTLTEGRDRLIKGIVRADSMQAAVELAEQHITIKEVVACDYGRPKMRHWEVSERDKGILRST